MLALRLPFSFFQPCRRAAWAARWVRVSEDGGLEELLEFPGELSLQLVDLGLHALDEHPKTRRQALELRGQFRLGWRDLAEEVVHPRQQVVGSRAGGHIMLLHCRALI